MLLDELGRRIFAEEADRASQGALEWQEPPVMARSEARPDGLLRLHNPIRAADLTAPWCLARSDEIVVDLRMQDDPLDHCTFQRALLRRQARETQRHKQSQGQWNGEEPLWVVASHVPGWLLDARRMREEEQGCYRLQRAAYSFYWIASNWLPLREELIPFLLTRRGQALFEFLCWVAVIRPESWLLRLMESLPVTEAEAKTIIDRHLPLADCLEGERQRGLLLQMLQERAR